MPGNKIITNSVIPILVLMTVFLFWTVSSAADSGTFTGSWSASGTRDVLSFGADRHTSLFKLAGHVNLKDSVGNESDYWAECIGLGDDKTGSHARCVWRSLNGQEIYLTLEATKLAEGTHVRGEIVGGTKSAKGITGSVEFAWSIMSFDSVNKVNDIGGYTKNLKGTYQLP